MLLLCVVVAEAGITLGQTGEAATVDVPLVRGFGDTRPRATVHLAEDERPILAILDLGGDRIRLGATMAARMGLTVRRGRTRLDRLRIGEVLIEEVDADVVRSDELVIGVGALSALGVAVLPSEGVVRFARDVDGLLAEVGAPIAVAPGTTARWRERGSRSSGTVTDAVPVTLDGVDGLARLRSDRATSTVGADVLGDALRVRAVLELPVVSQPLVLRRDEAIADPRPGVLAELGADGLAFLDTAVGGDRIAFSEVAEPRWEDAATVRRAWLEAEAPEWDAVRARRGWTELAELRQATGDVEGAVAADTVLEALIGDRCDGWLAVGERRLRSGAPGAVEALARAEAEYTTWEALGPEVRDRVRFGRRLPDGVSATRQPVDCERAAVLRVGLPSSEAGLRRVGAWTALAARRPGAEPSLAWARQVPSQEDPHPLTTALILGPELVAVALEADPQWVAGRIAAAAWTLPVDGPPVDPRREGVLHPGDPAVTCQVALSAALAGEGTIPDLPEADCLAASTLLAVSRGDAEIAAVTRSMLHHRWPDLVPDVAEAVAVHTAQPEEP